jgi:hypothetical protein
MTSILQLVESLIDVESKMPDEKKRRLLRVCSRILQSTIEPAVNLDDSVYIQEVNNSLCVPWAILISCAEFHLFAFNSVGVRK